MIKKEDENLFNIKKDERENLVEISSVPVEYTENEEVLQIISQLNVSAINIKDSEALLKDAIEVADKNATPRFIKLINNMQIQHKKYLEKLVSFKKDEKLTPEILKNIDEEIDKNTEFIAETDCLLEIAEDSLQNPEKYKKDFNNLLASYSEQKKRDKKQELVKSIEINQKKSEKDKKEKIITIDENSAEPVVVNIDSITEVSKKSDLEIEVTENIKGKVNINNSLLINKKNDKNHEKNTSSTYKKINTVLPSQNDINSKKTKQKDDTIENKNTQTEQETDAYDFMMKRKGSNAKKLVEFHIEDIEKD